MNCNVTNASRQFLDPDVVHRISNLEFQARHIVEGLISGRHRSPFFSQSVEFAQHREYVPGDDLRHLDWKVWGRADRLYIKQFEAETNLRATLILDASASMNYGAGDTHKYQYACQLAASLAYLLLRQADAVGLTVFDDQIREEVPHRSAQPHLRDLLLAMQTGTPVRKTDLHQPLANIAERDLKRGVMVLCSDLLAERQSVIRGLRALRQRRHDLVVFHLLHDDEMDFLFQGTTRFEELEGPDLLTCDPRALRAGYLAALENYLQEIRVVCRELNIDYRQVRTSQSVDSVLAELLHERLKG